MNVLKYMDLKFDHPKFNCWSLVDLIMRNENAVDTQIEPYTGSIRTCDTRFITELENWNKIDTPKAGALIVLNIGGKPLHCGYMVDSNRFIHVLKDSSVTVERIDSVVWRNRVEGFYLWRQRDDQD